MKLRPPMCFHTPCPVRVSAGLADGVPIIEPTITLSITFYSNRVPAALAQPVPIRLSLASKTWIAELEVNSFPLAPSSKAAITFCDPMNTPLAL